MRKSRLHTRLVVIVSFISFTCCLSQPSINSPYSRYGLGDIQNAGFAHNIALGGISNALQNDTTAPFHINQSNPASHASLRLTVFDFALKNSFVKLETEGNKFNTNRTALAYMALAFPVSKWWGTSFGLIPYSNVGYKIYDKKEQDSVGTVNYSYEGEGGINQLYWGNGFRIKRFYFGANISYLFGDMTYFSRDSFPVASNFLNTKLSQNNRISDMYCTYGMQYRQPLRKDWSMTLGASGSLSSDINIKKTTFAANYKNAFGVEVIKDTIMNAVDVKETITIPMMLGGGIVLKKGDKWLFGVDYSVQDWSQFKSFGQEGLLKNSQKLAVGVQYVPHKGADPKESYLRKMCYRAGLRYTDTYLDLKNTAIKDYALTLGLGFPLRRMKIIGANEIELDQKYSQSMMNFGLEIGQRGTIENQLIRYTYINAFISLSLNDKWFIKRKYD